MNNSFVLCVPVGVLCPAQEAESNQLPPPVPPHCHAHDLLGLHKILSWWVFLQLLRTHLTFCLIIMVIRWTRNFHRFHQHFRAHHHVRLLPAVSPRPSVAEIPLVEEVHHHDANGESLEVLVQKYSKVYCVKPKKLTLKNVFCLLSSLTSGNNFLSGPILHGLPAQHPAVVLRLRIP